MDIIAFSKLLIVFFVGSVTFWYVLTPYLVQPHPKIIDDVLSKTVLAKYGSSSNSVGGGGARTLQIENWTKWRLYVNSTAKDGKPLTQVIYGNSAASVAMEGEEAILNMEWRSDYHIKVSSSSSSSSSWALTTVAPASAASSYGIYNHFIAELDGEKKDTVKVLPRFLFGLPYETVDAMYGVDVDHYPIVGVFTESPKYDRMIIQAYMNIVTLSVIFLLWANNPPAAITKTLKKES